MCECVVCSTYSRIGKSHCHEMNKTATLEMSLLKITHSTSFSISFFFCIFIQFTNVLWIRNGLVLCCCAFAQLGWLLFFFHLTILCIQSFGSFLDSIVLIDNIRISKSFVKFRFCFYPIRLTNTAMFVYHRCDTKRY